MNVRVVDKITEYEIYVSTKKEPVKVRLLFLSDLHDQIPQIAIDKVMSRIHSYGPDLICVGGDMVVSKKINFHASLVVFLKELAKFYPVYYANGNHEQAWKRKKADCYRAYKEQLQASGICFLENKGCILNIKKKQIGLYGLELERLYFKRGKKKNLSKEVIEEYLGDIDQSLDYSVLLAHSPRYFDAYRKWGADLTLAGHYHGGLIRCGQRGLLSPYLTLFPAYCYGLYENKDKKMIVSGGMGDHYPNPRWGNQKEMVGLTLHL